MGKSGGGGSVGYIQSPEQKQLFNMWSPLVSTAAQFGRQNVPQPIGMRWIDPTTGEWSTPLSFQAPTPAPSPRKSDWVSIPPPISTAFLGHDTGLYGLEANDYIQAVHPELGLGRLPTGEIIGLSAPARQTARRLAEQWGGGGAGVSPTSTPAPGEAMGGMPIDLPLEYFAPFQPGLWPIPTYSIPSPEFMMPTARTMSAISPDVWSGILHPYNLAQERLMETLGAGGALGSARGGFSGQGAAGLGKFWAEAAPTIGLTGWSMIQPALQQAWTSELQKQQALWGEALQQFKYPWQAAPSFVSMSIPSPVVTQPGPSPLAGVGSLLQGVGSILPFII